jgi:hypothetical protein
LRIDGAFFGLFGYEPSLFPYVKIPSATSPPRTLNFFLVAHGRMLRLLHKRVRTHVFLVNMKKNEIEVVLNKYVPKLLSIQVLKSGTKKVKDMEEYLVLCDEYNWHEDRIVEEAREDLKKEFLRKLSRKIDPLVKKIFVASLR